MATAQILRRQTEKLASPAGRLAIVSTVVVWLAWIWLYTPTLRYLGHIFTIEDFRTNQIILIGIVGLIIYRWVEAQNHQPDQTQSQTAEPNNIAISLVLIGLSTILWLINERLFAINTISATLFGLGSYGLLGLTLNGSRWRNGLPAALLIIGTLPFGAHMETFLGYPLRIATATFVGDALARAGFASIGVDTILIFENGVSKVDLPCSGVQSLWTGALFFLAATWLEEKKLGIRWILALGFFAVALIVANTFRVAVLVTVGEALGWHLTAQMLHLPLGVLGFVAACAFALGLLRYFVPTKSINHEGDPQSNNTFYTAPQGRSHLPHFALLPLILFAGLVYSAKPITGLTAEPVPFQYHQQLELKAEPLKPDEEAWLTKDGADSAERMHFTWHSEHGTRTGSMILISSRSWRAHHRPERCFEVYGLDVNDSGTHLVNLSMPIRQVSLGNENDSATYQAVYWFQSADTVTDDYGSRMWADVTQPHTRWILVSVLFNETYSADDLAVQEFYLAMNETVANNLTETQK